LRKWQLTAARICFAPVVQRKGTIWSFQRQQELKHFRAINDGEGLMIEIPIDGNISDDRKHKTTQ
jgi:hypothetical protein